MKFKIPSDYGCQCPRCGCVGMYDRLFGDCYACGKMGMREGFFRHAIRTFAELARIW